MKRFVGKADFVNSLRRWFIWILVIVIGSGMLAVQGRGEDDHANFPTPIGIADVGDPIGGVEPAAEAKRADDGADSTSPLQDLLTWADAVESWVLVAEAFNTLAVPDAGHVAWELAAGDLRQAIHVLAWERDSESVQLRAGLAKGQVLGIEPVVAIADRLSRSQHGGGSAIAAVNADFFMGSPVLGQPIGIHVGDGELITDPNGRPLFALFDDGRVWIGEVEFRATVERLVGGEPVADYPLAAVNRAAVPNGLTLYTPRYDTVVSLPHADSAAVVLQALLRPLQAGATHQAVAIRRVSGPADLEIPAQGAVLVGRGQAAEFVRTLRPADRVLLHINFEPALTGVQQAVAGSHVLVWNGEVVNLDRNDPLVSARHPRTAIGYNDEAVFVVTVDGRQPGYANGMTLPELAELFVALGADAALNLDGGGSTTMAVRHTEDLPLSVVNRPSDGAPRPVSNALVLMSVDPLRDPLPESLLPSGE